MQKRIYLLSTLLPVLGFLFATPALSAEADLAKAEKVYKRSCATCHGKQGGCRKPCKTTFKRARYS